MPTARQRKVVEKMAENLRSDKPKSMGKILTEVGYSKNVSEKPKIVTESKGIKELLDQYLPDDFILKALRDDIEAKPEKRLGELALASKIKGLDKEPEPEKSGDTYNLTQVNIEASKDTARDIIEQYKEKTIGDVS